jgi:stress response protein YsnF
VERTRPIQHDTQLEESAARERSAHEETVIPVVQEELDVGTQRFETDSGVRVHKAIEEREVVVDELLTREDVDVQRVAINRAVEGPVAVRYEGDTMVVPILEEVVVVEKRLILKEEIRVTRRKTAFREPQRVILRSEHATVERIEDPGAKVSPADGQVSRVAGSGESLFEEKRRQNEDVLRELGSPAARE